MLEANRATWGCTSRNGGQGQNASGRLYRSQWIERWGTETARQLDAEIRGGFETFKSLVAEIDCDAQPTAATSTSRTAPKKVAFLADEARVMKEVFGYDTAMLERRRTARPTSSTIARPPARCSSPRASACIRSSSPTATCAWRARSASKVHPASPVIGWETSNGVHHLRTPGGTVRARAVGIATGGYTRAGPAPVLTARSCRSCRTRWSRVR